MVSVTTAAGERALGRTIGRARPARVPPDRLVGMTKWEYLTAPVLIHATKQILDNFGADGWELVQIVPGPDSANPVAYFKRPKAEQ
jgi:hypothetical protein